MTAERARLHGYLRVALLLQAAGMLATVALTVPDFIDYQTRPLECGWCLDFRGVPFGVSMTILGPVIVVLLLLAWRWRGPRVWPLAIVAIIDVLAVAAAIGMIIPLVFARTDLVPPAASAPLLLLLPAIATLALGTCIEWPIPWRPILAVSAALSLLPAACQGLGVIGPVHQSTPGELSLPFRSTTVYAGRDLGCVDWVQGWVDMHRCMNSTLVVYRGSGDVSKDIGTVSRVLAAHQQSVPIGLLVKPLPVDVGIDRTDSREVDASNAGACLIITDRASAPPGESKVGRCAMVTDYADIRSHWPSNDTYAIGIIYYWDRRDYRDQYSVTFRNQYGAQPGRSFTVAVRARPNTSCSIVVVDSTGVSNVQGLDPKTTDAAGNVMWTWIVDPGTKPGRWPIHLTCGAASGWSAWSVYGPTS